MSPITLLLCKSHLALGVGYTSVVFASFLLYLNFDVGIYIKNRNTASIIWTFLKVKTCSHVTVKEVAREKNGSIVKIMLGMNSFSNTAFKVNLKNAKCLFPVSLHAITVYFITFLSISSATTMES